VDPSKIENKCHISLKVNQCFGGIGLKSISKARNQHEVGRKQALAWLTL
jgi:hypothetical protein